MNTKHIKNKLKQIVGVENLDFLNHTKNYFSADLFSVGINFISVPIFTRYLMPDEYGIISVFISIISMIVIIMGCNLHAGIIRYYFERPELFRQALGTNLIFLLVYATIVLIVLFLNKGAISSFLKIDEQLFIAIILVSFSTLPFKMLMTYLQATKDSKKNSFIAMMKTSLTLGLAIILILAFKEQKYLGRIYSELAVSGVFCVYTAYLLYKMAAFSSWSWEYLRYTLSFSLPLIPHTISGFLLSTFDRIIIQQLTNSTNSGLYAFAYNIGMIMNILVMASSKSWQPIFFNEIKKENYQKINNMAHSYSNYIYFCAIGLMLFSKEIVFILADKKYFAALNIVPIIIVAYIFVYLYTLYFQYASYRKRTALISVNTMIAGIANVLLNYWLIPIYGYYVAAYNTLFSFLLLFVLHYLNAKYFLRENVIPLKMLLPRFSVVLVMLPIYYFILNQIENSIVAILTKLVVLSIAAYYLIYRKSKILKTEV